jgi:hypothetical protein
MMVQDMALRDLLMMRTWKKCCRDIIRNERGFVIDGLET